MAAVADIFFEVRDGPFTTAERHIMQSSISDLATCHHAMNQTYLFFAACRPVGQDAEALSLCRMLLDRGISVNHTDVARLRFLACMVWICSD
eukprot:symbB.v1.2.033632.t1/scaffold4207.1/size89611/3